MTPLFPFNIFREEIFVEVAILVGTVAGSITFAVTVYGLKRLHDWHAVKNLNRIVAKEDAIKNLSAQRVWHENR
jgi:uncharacterized protein (DUF697 family)